MNIEYRPRIEEQDKSDDWRSLGEKLAEAWKKQNPEIEKMTAKDLEDVRNDFEARENAVNDKEVGDVLAGYGFDVGRLTIEREIEHETGTEPIYRLPITEHFSDKRLPAGYGYAGGAARALLLMNLGIDPNYVPRDIDVVRLVEEEPYFEADHEIASRFMPDDYERGHGVRDGSDQDRYFTTRDLTINEVLATDSEIFVTRLGLLDTARHIIRLTEFEGDQFQGAVGMKMLSKILRFYVEAIHRYDDATIEGVDDWAFENINVWAFHFALQLDKAAEVSQEIAQEYVNELKRRKRLPANIETVDQAANYLYGHWLWEASDEQLERGFVYRHAPTEQIKIEDDWAEEYEKVFKTRSQKEFKKSR